MIRYEGTSFISGTALRLSRILDTTPHGSVQTELPHYVARHMMRFGLRIYVAPSFQRVFHVLTTARIMKMGATLVALRYGFCEA
ncbi:MAG: hypothetical protein DMG57_10870 [Acidobacteria bacterium]|nr:MAG: hypothetical protein DMG57_10870 [Acidobacteriota bacterium]